MLLNGKKCSFIKLKAIVKTKCIDFFDNSALNKVHSALAMGLYTCTCLKVFKYKPGIR